MFKKARQNRKVKKALKKEREPLDKIREKIKDKQKREGKK